MPLILPENITTHYTPFLLEHHLDAPTVNKLSQFMADNVHHTYWICAAYVVAIHAIKWAMRERAPLKLKKLLIVWNVCLAVFSIWGTCRISHHLLTGVVSKGVGDYFTCVFVEDDYLVSLFSFFCSSFFTVYILYGAPLNSIYCSGIEAKLFEPAAKDISCADET